MKNTIALLFFLLTFNLIGQQNAHIEGNIFNAKTERVELIRVLGNKTQKVADAKFDKKGNFTIDTEIPAVDYYALQIGDEQISLFLREQNDIKVYGDGSNLMSFVNILNSAESSNMFEFIQKASEWQAQQARLMQELKEDPSKKQQVEQQLKTGLTKFNSEIRSFVARNRQSPALYAAIPFIDTKNDFETYQTVITQLTNNYGDLSAVKLLAKQFEIINAERMASNKLAPGKEAPDFEEKMADGTTMKLSDLRGNIVLLDFWASWCGPCRRENPNVVRLYEQYKDKGFTVMSVSLDKDRSRWLEAIEKDNLSWPNHVSDLKYWSSEAAKLYGVSGIPFTVLIDKEGKIIKTKLRGPELANELERLLGSE